LLGGVSTCLKPIVEIEHCHFDRVALHFQRALSNLGREWYGQEFVAARKVI